LSTCIRTASSPPFSEAAAATADADFHSELVFITFLKSFAQPASKHRSWSDRLRSDVRPGQARPGQARPGQASTQNEAKQGVPDL
jgi:hypothetical protein